METQEVGRARGSSSGSTITMTALQQRYQQRYESFLPVPVQSHASGSLMNKISSIGRRAEQAGMCRIVIRYNMLSR